MTDILEPTTPKPPVPEPRRVGDPKAGSTVRMAILGALVVFAGIRGGWPLLVMIAALVVMIFLHELGHFLTAKWAGMKVTEFFIGFGPRIWSFHRGETEYGLKVIPAGAYVKIIGMHNLDEFDEADADRTYMSKPFWRRISVAVAGSTMHFLLAFACLFVAFAFVGVPGGGSLTDPGWVIADNIAADSPAGEAGVEAGDELVTVDGVDVSSFDEFREAVAARPGETVEVELLRDGRPLTLDVTLGERNPTSGEAVGFFGAAEGLPPDETVGVAGAVGQTVGAVGDLTMETFKGLGRILSPSGMADLWQRVMDTGDDAPAVVDSGTTPQQERDQAEQQANRPISILGITQIGADVLDENAGDFFVLFALVNMFIGIFNLVPLLPLDGGHVMIAVYEEIRAKLQGGRRYHVDVVKLLPLTYAVVLLLGFIGISTIFLDIADPIGS
jgi:membrane-associated protease RseP (regulator of RpoE activity)